MYVPWLDHFGEHVSGEVELTRGVMPERLQHWNVDDRRLALHIDARRENLS